MDIVQLITLIAVILGVGSLIRWWRAGFPKGAYPLRVYVITVAVVWAFILGVAWTLGTANEFLTLKWVFMGYWIGMFAMYIATRVYRS